MAIEFHEEDDGRMLHVLIAGKVAKEDYQTFVPEVDRLVQKHGKIRILMEMRDFHGWTAGALWKDIQFDLKHFRDIERVAMVGEKTWQKGMAKFCKPFTTADIRYFDRSEIQEAARWIHAEPAMA